MRDFHPQSNRKRKRSQQQKEIKGIFSSLPSRISALLVYGLIGFLLIQIPSHLSSPLKSVRIHGNELLEKAAVAKYLRLREKQSWFRVDPYEASVRLRESPWIEKAIVRKNLEHGLDVYITERKPVAFIKTQNQMAMICQDHLVLEPLGSRGDWNLPVIVNNTLKVLSAGQFLKPQDLNGALPLMELLRNSSVLPIETVSEIIVDDPLNIKLITIPNGIKVKLGFQNYREKLRNLALASRKIKETLHKISIIDLRHKGGVVITHKY